VTAPATQIDLAAFAPDFCQRGHQLRRDPATRRRQSSNKQVSWRPCICVAALDGGTKGHIIVRCLACHVDGVDQVYLDPPCEGSE